MNDDSQRGNWMQTYTGEKFYPLDPRPEEVNEQDIAHALSLICRYGGHSLAFYSVAEHCVLLSLAVPSEFALWALLHDAAEAYVGDMVRPLKRMLPHYSVIEDGVLAAILRRFDVEVGPIPDEVKEADNRIILTERAAVMQHTEEQWAESGLEPLPVAISCWDPGYAERRYLQRLEELTR